MYKLIMINNKSIKHPIAYINKYVQLIDKDLVRKTRVSNEELYHELDPIISSLPFIPTRENWIIRTIHPFAGAYSRLVIGKKGITGNVSMYLDMFDALGYVNQVYYEIYPVQGKQKDEKYDDPFRFYLGQEEAMADMIDDMLNNFEQKDNYEQ
jgi:hypothetical protein